RIDRRNPEDIFTPLYNHQIPPGAAATLHYALELPESMPASTPVTLTARVNYRKFDTAMMRQVEGEAFERNDLPVTVLGEAQAVLGRDTAATNPGIEAPLWIRWNDYGIGLLRAGEFRQAQAAFEQVARMGHGLGFLNLARTLLGDGRLAEAADALEMAGQGEHPAYPWAVAYWTGELNYQNGFVAEAIAAWTDVEQTRFNEARARGFDFSQDYRLLDRLGQAWLEHARLTAAGAQREARLEQAQALFERALALDPERAESHYGLAQVLRMRGDRSGAEQHAQLHQKYRVDDNARDRAIALARARDPAADHAADAIVIYPLTPPGENRSAP
ncbi:MAG: tetratricopeptide repeat protein, partial [Wenzhouxiangellaceae bacterium]